MNASFPLLFLTFIIISFILNMTSANYLKLLKPSLQNECEQRGIPYLSRDTVKHLELNSFVTKNNSSLESCASTSPSRR
jgi:hypothetical protein